MSQVILWIEDRPDDVKHLIAEAKNNGYTVVTVAMPHRIRADLEENQNNLAAIVVDVMLYGVHDLKGFGKEGIPTDMGLEAGWAIIEHYLRTPDSLYWNLPILVLSTRKIDTKQEILLDTIQQKGGGTIEYIEKREFGWQKRFSNWLNNLKTQEQKE
jgi:CheY-like chemotaxis protein